MNAGAPSFTREPAAWTAMALFVLPVVAVNANYLIAAAEGFVPWCNPYLDSCTSISATGRRGAGFVFFKATMLPMSLLYLAYWRHAGRRLARAGYTGGGIRRLGAAAAAALVCYVLALGAMGEHYQLVRRVGVILYFSFTFLCQLLVLRRIAIHRIDAPGRGAQLALCALILCLGLLTVALDALLPGYDEDYANAFEWNLALLVHLNFALAGWGWARAGDRRTP